MKIFGERLRELRKENNLSSVKLGKYLEIPSATILRWENNIMSPKAEYIVMIAKYFNVTTDFLLGLED